MWNNIITIFEEHVSSVSENGYLHSARRWWSSYVATINKETGRNKPLSKLKLFKK